MIRSYQLTAFSFQRVTLVPNLRFGMHTGSSASKMLAKGLLSVITVILITSSSLFAQSQKFDQLKERFDSGEVFAATFDHTYTDSYTGESTASEGQIWIDQIRYKLNSDGQTILVDGETSRVYDSNRNRVIIDFYDPEDDDFAPSRMLSGIDSTYSVSEENRGAKTLITLTTSDDFAVFSEVEILLDAQLRPIRITAWDFSDNEIVTNFSSGRFLTPEPGLFQLNYPEDAEVVDMRY